MWNDMRDLEYCYDTYFKKKIEEQEKAEQELKFLLKRRCEED